MTTFAPMIRRSVRDAPQPQAPMHTLLDVANVLEGNPLLEPSGLYLSLNCITTDTVTTMCPDNRGTKNFAEPVLVNGIRFPVYSGVTCRPVGGDFNELATALDKVQRAKESQAVEKALMQVRFTGVDGGAAAEDLTPTSGAVSPRVGLAILEGHARHFYAGVPTLHIPATIGGLLREDAFHDDNAGDLVTAQGSKVAFGSGYEYPNNGPAVATPVPAGELWMYASGQVTVERGQRRVVEPQLSYSNNQSYALVETFYVADVDCYVSAVRVKIA